MSWLLPLHAPFIPYYSVPIIPVYQIQAHHQWSIFINFLFCMLVLWNIYLYSPFVTVLIVVSLCVWVILYFEVWWLSYIFCICCDECPEIYILLVEFFLLVFVLHLNIWESFDGSASLTGFFYPILLSFVIVGIFQSIFLFQLVFCTFSLPESSVIQVSFHHFSS